ncbi:DMT family transporter [Sphingomonas sp. IW22]|uniref:DMT family transporter n=1 Tax=Sphingomonas sp. IW22 TaxID=3242489 RepID=UPI0035201785
MNALIPIVAALLAGVGVAVQTPTNAALGRTVGSVTLAALVSFSVGTVILLAAWLLADRTPLSQLKGARAWMLLGGAYGAYFVAAVAFAVPRLGLASMLTIVIASQLIAALVIDHFGLLGLPRAPIGIGKVIGVLLVLGGVVLVRRP